ncbi:MAG: restriction endonuclease subunit M, partial [Chloroflexi bacterium]|nr:restriction endonuclease subunit M [Chloroflexota bacterium]
IVPYRDTDQRMELIAEQELRNSFPMAYAYLRENREFLESREKGRMSGAGWYGYVYPKNLDVMKTPKILVPDIADRASFALDQAGEYAFTSGYGITLGTGKSESVKYVLGLLDSGLLDFFLKKVSTTMRGGFFRYFTQYIEQLPIRTIDFSDPADVARHERMVSLVERMLALHQELAAARTPTQKTMLQRQIEATDRQIDRLVYELYELTEEEIAVVERSTA